MPAGLINCHELHELLHIADPIRHPALCSFQSVLTHFFIHIKLSVPMESAAPAFIMFWFL